MKKLFTVAIAALLVCAMLPGCAPKTETQPTESPDTTAETPAETPAETDGITADMALEGVSNYCHETVDWSIAEDNPEMMYVTLGEESETEYQVIFRSYTGSFRYFYVDKETGTTRVVDYVPSLNIEEDAETIELSDYLN